MASSELRVGGHERNPDLEFERLLGIAVALAKKSNELFLVAAAKRLHVDTRQIDVITAENATKQRRLAAELDPVAAPSTALAQMALRCPRNDLEQSHRAPPSERRNGIEMTICQAK